MSYNNYFGYSQSSNLNTQTLGIINNIPASTWNYLSIINQGLASTSSPTFINPTIKNYIDLYDPTNTTFKTTIKPVSSHLSANRNFWLPDNDLNLTFPTFMYLSTTTTGGLHWNLEARGNRRWQFLMDDDTAFDGLSNSHNLRIASILDNDTTFINALKIRRATGAIGINLPSSTIPAYQVQCKGGIGLYTEGALADEDLVNIERHSNDGHGAYFNIKRSAGTYATPATLGGAATLGGLLSYAYTTDWKLSSSIYFDCTAVSGANHSSNISFFTNNVGTPGERMRISPDGKVGIGTDIPSYQLDVLGDINVNNETNAGVLRGLISRQYTTDASAPLVSFFKSRGTKASPTTIAASDYIGGITTYAYTNASKQGASILIKANAIDSGTKQLSSDIEFHTVNVGTSALAMSITGLGVCYLPSTSTSQFQKLIPAGSNIPVFNFKTPAGFGAYVVSNEDVNRGTSLEFKHYDYNTGSILTHNTLTLAADGKVGVNTAAPTEALEVVGNIKSTGIINSGAIKGAYRTESIPASAQEYWVDLATDQFITITGSNADGTSAVVFYCGVNETAHLGKRFILFNATGYNIKYGGSGGSRFNGGTGVLANTLASLARVEIVGMNQGAGYSGFFTM